MAKSKENVALPEVLTTLEFNFNCTTENGKIKYSTDAKESIEQEDLDGIDDISSDEDSIGSEEDSSSDDEGNAGCEDSDGGNDSSGASDEENDDASYISDNNIGKNKDEIVESCDNPFSNIINENIEGGKCKPREENEEKNPIAATDVIVTKINNDDENAETNDDTKTKVRFHSFILKNTFATIYIWILELIAQLYNSLHYL